MKLLICTQVVDKNHPILGFFHGWIAEFGKHFEKVYVIALGTGEYSLPDNVTVLSLGKERGVTKFALVWNFYKHFRWVFFTEQVDFAFFHMGAVLNILAAPFFLVRKMRSTTFIWWKTYGHLKWFEYLALRFVDQVATASGDSFPVDTPKKRVVGHAINTEDFHIENISKEGMVFIGRIMPVKCVDQVLEIARKLKEQGNETKLRIIGTEPDQEYKQSLLDYVDKHDLGSSVTFVGPITHAKVVTEFKRALISINPSNTDSIDKVVLEAMVGGSIPVTNTLAFAEMLKPFGLFTGKNDTDAMVEVVKRILAMSEQERAELSQSLRNIVVDNHALGTLPTRLFGVS